MYIMIINGDNSQAQSREYRTYKEALKDYNYLYGYLPPYGYNHAVDTHIYKIFNNELILKK